jgi:PAS domain S-box-containing protein
VAAVLVVAAVGLRRLLDPLLGENYPFATVVLAVLLAAGRGGLGPGLFAAGLGGVLTAWLVFVPRGTFAVGTPENQGSLAVFLAVAAGVAALGGSFRRAREDARAALATVTAEREDLRQTLARLGVVFRDASEPERAEAARRHLAAIVESSEDAIYSSDLNGVITSWNAAAERVYGYPPAEVLGRPFAALMPTDRADDADQLVARIRRGERIDHFETVRRRQDGGLVDVSVSFSPVRDAGGRLVGAAVITRDISTQRQALAALRASEARFAAVIQNAPAVVFVKDPDGVYLMANPQFAAYAGRPVEAVLGKTDAELFPPEVAAAFRKEDEAVLAGGRVQTFEEAFPYGGVDHTFLTAKFPLPDSSDRPMAVCGIATDITARKAAEERVVEEGRIAETLGRIGMALASELELPRVVQLVTDEATRLTEAQFGAFFHNVPSDRGESYTLYALAGAPREKFDRFPMPRNTALFAPTFRGEGVVRLDDVTRDPRYGKNAPHFGKPEGHLPVTSYLAAPVVSRSGEVVGGLFFGHARVGVFTERHERLVTGIAAQAAIAIDNARLYGRLQESEERFRQLAEHIGAVFWLADVRTDQILYASPAYRDIWGRSPESLYADRQSYLEGIHRDDRERVRAANAAPPRGEFLTEEYRVVRPDGSIRWVADRGFPIRDADGRVVRVAGLAEDITDRKRRENAGRFLAGASSALAALTDADSALQKVAALAVPDFADWCAVDMTEANGVLRRVAVAHVDPDKVRLAHEIQRRWPPDPDAPTGVPQIIRSGQAELVGDITDPMLAGAIPDPELLGVMRELGLRSYIGVPLTVRGKTLGAITFIAAESGRRYDAADLDAAEDLARRAAVAVENAQLYEALKDADRRKDEFLATLAHELRNPLAPIRNSLYLLKSGAAPEPARHQAREMMERQVHHLVRLVDDLLDVSRVMRGKVDLREERVDVAAAAARAVETAQPLIDARRHTLTVDVPAAPVWVEADPVRLAQVVGNLLTNAAKYTDVGGRITLAVEQAGGEAVVRVRDTGIGIAPDMLPRVFDLFVQADTTADRSHGGLGIGLTLVKRLVELHGGSVAAHSAGPARGSEFVVRLPLLAAGDRRLPIDDGRSEVGNPQSAVGNRRRVLVVDDHADAADSLAMMLRAEGHDVRVARNGPDALAAVRASPPEVMLLDLGMPGMDGFEVARQVRNDGGQGVLLVALTGWGQEEDRRRTRAAGFDHHLVKPADPAELRTLLARVRT